MNRFLFLITLVWSCIAHGEDLKSWQVANNVLSLQTAHQQIRMTARTNQSFEVLYQANKRQIPSFSLTNRSKQSQRPIEVIENGQQLHVKTTSADGMGITATITKSPLSIRYEYQNRYLTTDLVAQDNQPKAISLAFSLQPSEKLLGGGERVLGMDRRGVRLPLYNRAHYGYGTHSEQMNFSIPAVMSSRKYTLLFDNTAKGWMDIGSAKSNELRFEAEGGRHAYLITAAESYPKLIASYVELTGKQPLPPRWAFGNHASRFGYRSQQEVLDTIERYRSEQIPVDSIILDLYWFGPDVKGHMGNLDWDTNTFPEPEKMITQLADQGVKTVLITEPFILTSSSKFNDAVKHNALALDGRQNKVKTFDFFFGHTGLVDVFSPSGKDWFAAVYQRLAAQGVAGVWGDLGEPEVHPSDMTHKIAPVSGHVNTMIAGADEVHNAYGHVWGELVYDALAAVAPKTRQFMIMRSGFAGSQRFGMIPWTGDVSRSWDGLKPQVELSLQMSLLGLAYTHSDLGGFAGGATFDQEMYLRWLQYGVFQPIYRPHAQDAIAPEPVFHDQQTIDIARQAIELRYRLLPYNYTLAFENSTSGMPLMRAMFFENEADLSLIDIKDQYFWGDSFLVKPVTEPGVRFVSVQLPPGYWFDYWTDEIYANTKTDKGLERINVPVSINTIPVLVRAGAIIPSVEVVQTTADYSSEKVQLDYFFHPSVTTSDAKMYDDDGVTTNTGGEGAFEIVTFKADVQQTNHADIPALTFNIKRQKNKASYLGQPVNRQFRLTIHNWRQTPRKVSVGDGDSNLQFEYEKASQQLVIEIPDVTDIMKVKVFP